MLWSGLVWPGLVWPSGACMRMSLFFFPSASLLDLYTPFDRGDLPLARHSTVQAGRPPISYHGPWRSAGERKQWEGWGW